MASQQKPKRPGVPDPRPGSAFKRMFILFLILIVGVAGYLGYSYHKETGEIPFKDKEKTIAFLKGKLNLAKSNLQSSQSMAMQKLAVGKEAIQKESKDIENWFQSEEVQGWVSGEKIKPAETWDDMMKVAGSCLPEKSEAPKKAKKQPVPIEKIDPDAAKKLAAERAAKEAAYEEDRKRRLTAAEEKARQDSNARLPQPEPEPEPAKLPEAQPKEEPKLEEADPVAPPPAAVPEPEPTPPPTPVVAPAKVEVVEEEVPAQPVVAEAEPKSSGVAECKGWMRDGSVHLRNAYKLPASPKKQKEIRLARDLFGKARAKLSSILDKEPNNEEVQRMIVDCNSAIWFCNRNTTL